MGILPMQLIKTNMAGTLLTPVLRTACSIFIATVELSMLKMV